MGPAHLTKKAIAPLQCQVPRRMPAVSLDHLSEPSAQSVDCTGLVVRMMVAIDPIEHLLGHTEKAADLMNGDSALGQPRCARVAKGVRHNIHAQPCERAGRPKCLVDLRYPRAVPLDHGSHRCTFPVPSSHVGEESRRNANGGLALLRGGRTDSAPVKNSAVEVDPAASNRRGQGSAADCTGSRSRIQTDEHKTRDVPKRMASCAMPFLNLAVPPRAPQQRCSLTASEPPIPGEARARRQSHGREGRTQALGPVMSDSRAKVGQLAPRRFWF